MEGIIASPCAFCVHGRKDGNCAAFPDGIPKELEWGGVSHDKPYPGDNGYRWTLKPELAELERLVGGKAFFP